MFLESASIKNFRSIEEIHLAHCGGLNILIGKNNAGKSNILSAIHVVFSCVKGGRIVVPRPPIGNELNFFNGNTADPIEITLKFSLAASERDVLLRDIGSEAPHVKNALDGLDPALRLSITLTVAPSPELFSVVSRIALCPAENGKSEAMADRLILQIGNEAARELYAKASKGSQMMRDVKTLKEMPERIPMSLRRRGPEREDVPIGYILRNLGSEGISSESASKLEALIRSSPETEDLTPGIRNLVASLEREASDLQREQLKNKIKTFSGEETAVPQYVLSLLERIGGLGVLYLQERRKTIGKEEAQRLLELKMSRGGPQVLRRIQETVVALLGVQIDAFRGDSRSPRSEAEAELDVDNFLVQVNGSGIRESLRLILDNEFERPSLLLIEEPEVHLHPALEASMMRYLQSISGSCQVFLTTHSTNFLDTAELSNVYLVARSGSTTVQLLDVGTAETLLPRELGLRMSSLFMYDRLVFVEGRTDEGIIREWASVLNVNLSQANVGFVRMGGVRNFSHYAAAATLSFLSKRQVRSWILLDRDEKDEEEINRLKKVAGDCASVNVLEHREIENLLLHPRAILELVKFKLRAAGKQDITATQQAVEDRLREALDALKPVAIHKRVTKALCTPLFPSQDVHEVKDGESIGEKIGEELDRMINVLTSLKMKIDETRKEKTDQVEANWAAQKEQLVPGDLALDSVLRGFGVRFNKDHDGPRLAALMREEEIEPGIKALIRELGAM